MKNDSKRLILISMIFIGVLTGGRFVCVSSADEKKSIPNEKLSRDVKPRDPLPFWRQKPKVFESMLDERRIVVTADTEKRTGSDVYKMNIKSAGVVNSSLKKSWQVVKDFESLPKADSRFLEAKYFEDKQRLYLHLATFGYHAKMIMELGFGESSRANEIHFRVVEGHYVGMSGVIRLEEVNTKKTEISLESEYSSPKLPLPKMLMGIGLEILGANVASSMREFIELKSKELK